MPGRVQRELGCVQGHDLGAFMLGCVLSARPTNRSATAIKPEMCSERDSPLKRLYRRTHAKLTRLAGSG